MKVLFFSIKGGQGKTTHAISYAKHRDCVYLTNDFESGTLDIYQEMFSENQLQVMPPDDELIIPPEMDVVFDFGGWVDERAVSIASQCDVIVVPIYYQSVADLLPCIKVVKSLTVYNKNIVLLINNTDKKDVASIQKGLAGEFADNKIFIFNRTKFVARLANEGKTIKQLSDESGLSKYVLRDCVNQLNEFYKYLDGF